MAQPNAVPPGHYSFGQASGTAFGGPAPLDSGSNDPDQLSQYEYLNHVLTGASPMKIVDHGIGPFEDKTTQYQPSGFGVICILNIPYNATKSEIEHFLGRNASMIAHNEHGCSIHIIMERPTSKTMDCFVELLSPEAATEAYQKHENLVMSGKHPRIGTRHVDVANSSQDALLQAIFPRARGLVWENGVPRKVENTDPYSSGFQGFFTREEMIGMYRHAETPQRSPFSVKCLQRTFECMISTLYKFPWHAQHMYTLEERAQLFDCFMKQLTILIPKVAEARTVGLDTKLLIDFVSAGLNCAGFGERMKYMIAAHSGQIGASFPINRKSAAWPFDTLSVPFLAPDGQRWWFEHEATLDLLMYIIDLGHKVCGNNYMHSEWIKVLPHTPPSEYDDQNVVSVRFKFKEDVFDVSYDEIVSRETELLRQMLQVGFASWTEDMRRAWKGGRFNNDMRRDVDCLAGLQQMEQVYGIMGPLSVSQSPKGTPTAEGYGEYAMQNDGTLDSLDVNATPRASKGIDPTVDPFEPLSRRSSEPNVASSHEDVLSPVRSHSYLDISSADSTPRQRQSSAVAIRQPDGTVVSSPSISSSAAQAPIGGHRGSIGRSPRTRHARGAFSVGSTIHEENEDDENEEGGSERGAPEEVIMMAGRSRRSSDQGL